MPPPRPAPGRTALFILGAPGSGAATLARVLEAAGAAAPADAAAVAAFNDRRLADGGGSWTDPFGPRSRGTDAPAEADPDQVAAARALLRTAEPHPPLLVLADPRHTRLAALWTAALEAEGLRAGFIVLVRAPGAAAAALGAADGVTRNRGLLLWGSYMLEAERVARGGRRVAVAFDRLAADPEAELDRIERGLDVRLPRRTWDSAAEIEALLRHEAAPPATAGLPPALAPLQNLHAHLQASAQDEPENTDRAAETARWFASLADVLGPVLHQVRREAAGGLGAAPGAGPGAGPGGGLDGGRGPQDEPDLRAELDSARRDAKAASARIEEAEARVGIVQAALTVARRRSAEAETLLQSRATEASVGEREARAALADALSARDAARQERDGIEARLELAGATQADLEQRLDRARTGLLSTLEIARSAGQLADARQAALDLARSELDAAHAARANLELRLSEAAAEIQGEEARHLEARERLALTGLSNLAAQARMRELQSQLEAAKGELERRRRWLPRLFGLR